MGDIPRFQANGGRLDLPWHCAGSGVDVSSARGVSALRGFNGGPLNPRRSLARGGALELSAFFRTIGYRARQGKTTKEYLRADRLALRRSPRGRSRHRPRNRRTTLTLRACPRSLANEDGRIELGWNRNGRTDVFVRIHDSAVDTAQTPSSFADKRSVPRSATVEAPASG